MNRYNKIMSKLISSYKQPINSFSQLLKDRFSPQIDQKLKKTASSLIQQQTAILNQKRISDSHLLNQYCTHCQEIQAELQCLQCNKGKFCKKCFDYIHDGVKFSLHQTKIMKKEHLSEQKNIKQEEKKNILMENMSIRNGKNYRNSILQKQLKRQQKNAQYTILKKKSQIYLLNLQQKIHRVNSRWDIIEQVFKRELLDIKDMIKEVQNNMEQEIKNKRSQQLSFIYKVFQNNSLESIRKQLIEIQNQISSDTMQVEYSNKMKQFCTLYDQLMKSLKKRNQLIPTVILQQFQQTKCYLKKIDFKIILSNSRNKSYILEDHKNIYSKGKSKCQGHQKNNISFFNVRKAKDKGKYQSSYQQKNNSFISIIQSEVDKTQVKKVKSQTNMLNDLTIPRMIKLNKRSKVCQGITLRLNEVKY